MKVATTKQFRNAVRQAMKELDITAFRSWTDASRGRGAPSNVRYVAFMVPRSVAGVVIERVEQILDEHGLDADVRCTVSGYVAYVRGVCQLA